MTKAEIKAFFATPKGKLTGAVGALLLCWAIILPTMFGDFFTSSDDPRQLRALENEIKKQRVLYEKQLEQKKQLDDLRSQYRAMLANAWVTERDGMVEIGLRQKVSDAAAKLEFKLHSLGAVRINRVNNDLSHGEIDVNGAETLDVVMKFISEISKLRPAVSWRRLDLRPDMRFRHMNSRSNTASLLNMAQQNLMPTSTRVSINGTLRVVITEQPVVQSKIAGKDAVKGAAGKTADKTSVKATVQNGGK